jgi:hypothetical protein
MWGDDDPVLDGDTAVAAPTWGADDSVVEAASWGNDDPVDVPTPSTEPPAANPWDAPDDASELERLNSKRLKELYGQPDLIDVEPLRQQYEAWKEIPGDSRDRKLIDLQLAERTNKVRLEQNAATR